MRKFTEGQRVVLDVDPSDLVDVAMNTNPLRVEISKSKLYHIKAYSTQTFGGEPMVTLKETENALFLEKLFKTPKRKRLVKFVTERLSHANG